MVYGHFLYDFMPIQPCLGLRRNNANLLEKCGQLVLLGLVPKTTRPLKNYYGVILWDLKHNKIPNTIDVWIINSFLHVSQVYTTFAN